MPANDTASLVRQIYTAYNDRQFDRAVEVVAQDFVWTDPSIGETLNGPEGQRQYMQTWATAFPDSRVEVVNIIANDNSAVVEFIGRGKHEGTLKTPVGDIPATGKNVEVHFCDIHEVRNGKIARSRTYFNAAALFRQLGVGA